MPASRFAQLFVFRTCFAHVFCPSCGGFWSVHCSQENRGGGGGGAGGGGGDGGGGDGDGGGGAGGGLSGGAGGGDGLQVVRQRR